VPLYRGRRSRPSKGLVPLRKWSRLPAYFLPRCLVRHLAGRGSTIGVYGFLSRAHIEHAVAGDIAVAGRAADVEARMDARAVFHR
jgi:hypothetical protein